MKVPEIKYNTRSVIFEMICKESGLSAALTWAMFGSYEDDISPERADELVKFFLGEHDDENK